MSLLLDLLPAVNYTLVQGNLEQEINELVFDSRKASADSVFFAIAGSTNNGHDYIQSVYENGCRVFVVQETSILPMEATIIKVANTSEALGLMACAYYDNPSQDLKLIGITGTNGKTTTTTLLHKLFTELGFKCGLISTVVNKIGTEEIPSTHTTPDPINLNALLARMVAEGCTYCFMEVSSHAIHQHRITGL
jgi:UDP-N-acetylmuramoyl-L-alanyl-D-glutamate--2,6-diaminopimelate ligase